MGQVKVWSRVGSTLALNEVHTVAAVNGLFAAPAPKLSQLPVCLCTFAILQRSLSLSLQVRFICEALERRRLVSNVRIHETC